MGACLGSRTPTCLCADKKRKRIKFRVTRSTAHPESHTNFSGQPPYTLTISYLKYLHPSNMYLHMNLSIFCNLRSTFQNLKIYSQAMAVNGAWRGLWMLTWVCVHVYQVWVCVYVLCVLCCRRIAPSCFCRAREDRTPVG